MAGGGRLKKGVSVLKKPDIRGRLLAFLFCSKEPGKPVREWCLSRLGLFAALFAVGIHLATIRLAWRAAGVFGALISGLLPGVAEFYWGVALWFRPGSEASVYSLTLVVTLFMIVLRCRRVSLLSSSNTHQHQCQEKQS